MNTYLFIGGPADGKRFLIPSGRDCWVIEHVEPTRNVARTAMECLSAVARSRTYYHKEVLRCGDRNWDVFVVEGEQANIVSNLINGYKGTQCADH